MSRINTERLRKATWNRCLAVVAYRLTTARVLTPKQRELVLAEKDRITTELALLLHRESKGPT